MFFGSFKHSIDDKGRLVLPAKFRFAFPDKIYLLKGSDGAIELYNEKDFNDYLSHLSSFPFEKKRAAISSVLLLRPSLKFRWIRKAVFCFQKKCFKSMV